MPTLVVMDRSGNEHVLTHDGLARVSVMEIIRDSGVEKILALCGGCCSCSTCHVYVDTTFLSKLPPMSREEAELLDGSDHRNEQSRLSCQIRFREELDSLKVTVAPED